MIVTNQLLRSLFKDLSLKLMDKARTITRALMSPHSNSGHGPDHCEKVLFNGQEAVKEFQLTPKQTLSVLVACLLHDSYDPKLFPNSDEKNALDIMQACFTDDEIDQELVIKMIDLVSCSKNGNSIDDIRDKWLLIPRDADRVEALGEEGIKRCLAYTLAIKRPLYTTTTLRFTDRKDLKNLEARMETYMQKKCSDSMIDHYYDKLLHIGVASSGSSYLQKLMDERISIMKDFVIDFGTTPSLKEWERRIIEKYA